MTTISLRIPSRVWYDYLDPNATAMHSELGLDDCPREYRRVGYGGTFVYRDVPVDVARELADYLDDRGAMLIGQDDESLRPTHRRAMRLAEQIRREVSAAK